MDSKYPVVLLPDRLRVRCERYGQEVVRSYAAGLNPASRAVSSHGAERDWDLQARAKMAEVACCLYFGIDPETALNWSQHCDSGFDLDWLGLRIDVKVMHAGSSFLIWPVNKRHIFDSKRFDVFVLVEERLPEFALCGFMRKGDFRARKREAGEGHKLTPGTWFVERDKLDPIEELSLIVPPGRL
jgi:hypothetical protein